MANGIFDDDLLELDESPETGQDFEEQATGPEGQPEGSTTDEEARELTPEELEQQKLETLKSKHGDDVDNYAKAVRELERKLGSRDDEREQLKQQNAQLQQQLYMLQGYLQALPQMGQQQPTPEQQQAKDEYDELLAEFEQLYPGLTKAMTRQQERAMAERLAQIEQRVGQTIAPVQQFMMQEHFNRQALELAAKYPDFKDYAQDMMQIYGSGTPLAEALARMPDGMEKAYEMAKARHITAHGQAAQVEAGKAAARLPGSSGARTAKPQDAEKAFLADIFGGGEPTGIFDDL
jgi:CII-binding regulator of phage lambda lysogenization HflD